MENYILSYNDKIQSGEIKASSKVKAAYSYLAELANGKFPDYHYEPKLAEKVIRFIETFCNNFEGKFAGQPMKALSHATCFTRTAKPEHKFL